jgi:chemotaxis protein MotB
LSPEAEARLTRAGVKVEETAEGLKLTFASQILFSSGSADVQAAAKKPLGEAAKVIKSEFAHNDLLIQGHTDNQPIKHSAHKFKTNEDLSVARAKSVAAFLQKEGVKNHMRTEGFGDTAPVADNKTAEGRAHNRRVELIIAGAGAAGESAPAPAPKHRPATHKAAAPKAAPATGGNDLK